MRNIVHLSKKSFSAIIAGLLLLCTPCAWAETFTIDCTTSSSDALFAVSGNGTQYDYDSRWTSSNLIKMDQGDAISITNVTGATITAISVEGVADNNSNKTVNFTVSDGTTSAATSSGSWNNRKSASMTSKDFNATNVGKLKHGEGQTYTITNNSSSSYNAGVRFVITYTPAATPNYVYLKPGVWDADGARFAVYCYGDGEQWYDMSSFEDACAGTIYRANVDPKYPSYIFCRMDGGNAENIWENRWNQTDNLTAANGIYCTITGWGSGNSTCTFNKTPYCISVSGSTWLAFKGESVTLTATACAGATHFQWYKENYGELTGKTSATLTFEHCNHQDGGNYYCKAWATGGEAEAVYSDVFGLKVPYLAIQTGGGGDRQDLDFVRANTSAETATCEIYLGVAWDYEMMVIDGIDERGNTGKMSSDNCTNWTMDQLNNHNWCRIHTSKEGTYHFTLTFSNTSYVPVKLSATYPPMQQVSGIKVYIENTPAMQANGWNTNSVYYRIGKGKYDKGDPGNWTATQQMTLVPGTDRYLQTTTPDWSNDFWVWHIANNKGDEGTSAIYRTYSDDGYPVTKSSNFNGDEIDSDRTIYLNSTSGGYGADGMNNNCEFYGYTSSDGMLTHSANVGATTNGQIKVNWTDYNGAAQESKLYTARTLSDLAHTCILTIAAVPDNGYRCTSLQVNGADFTSGSTHILAENATITATFDHATYTVTLHENGGTINAGNVTSYTHGTGATLPSDVTKENKEFGGWYDNEGCAGDPVMSISTTEWGNKEYWAKWIDEVPKVTYILGSCNVTNGMWTQGSDGSAKAWLFQAGATVAENNLIATTDISYSPNPSTAGMYFNTKDITKLDVESQWSSSSGSNKAIKALKVSSGSTQTFNLSGMVASKISFYVFPASNDAYSIDLTVNGVTTNQPIAKNSQNKWHKYAYKGGNYTGEFSIRSIGKETRVVVIVEVPLVTIRFDKNAAAATGTMADQLVPKGSQPELNSNAYQLADHEFLGWTEDAEGTGILISDGAEYSTETDVTLYAQWRQIIKTHITLVASEAYNKYTTSVDAVYGNPMPEISALPKRTGGYVFDGYYTEPGGAGTKYYGGLGNSVRNWDQTDPTATLYAKWLAPCDLVPTLSNVVPVVTIWDQKEVDQGIVKLSYDYDASGVEYSLQSAVPSEPITGCTFQYFDDHIHIMGTPNLNNTTTKTITVTFTMTNSCDPATVYNIVSTIRIYPADQKPKIAFIITGTKGGAFDAYSASDATSCNDLVTYLGGYYDITFVNGYATKDADAIAAYYDQYDLLVVTDFLNTGEGYTNVIGTLIDKKPILSFEAYVANLSNWHIGSNPKDPKPKVQDMKVLCAGHAIFKNAKYNPGDAEETTVVNAADTTVHVLSTLSSNKDAKGLQGFTINEAPDFVFLATVRDENNGRDLIVCCERQVVFPARLLLYGINFYEMPNLSPAGQIVMRQMIDYLLMTNETKVADCSLVFDNHSGDHLWSNPGNWAPGYNIVPTPYHGTRIIAECHVTNDDAHAGSVKINKGRDEHGNPVNGNLIVMPSGGLTIAGMVAKVNDTRYATPIAIKADELLIQADAGGNGAFVYGNKESDVRATVQYFSLGNKALTTNPEWQYMGIPFQAGHTAIEMYRNAWMCRWTSATTDELGGLWQWVENDVVLIPFEGYCITQEATKTYQFSGKLNPPVTTTVYLDNRDGDGYAFAANSWTAPIKIQEMADADFVNAEKSIYIYHTGSYANWLEHGNPAQIATEAAATMPGQYAVIPIHSSPYMTGADSVIPAMQGFFVKATAADAQLKLVYNRVVYDATYFKTSTQPMRAPRRNGYAPEVMVLSATGASFGDRVHLLSRGDFSEEYTDGWDGRKIDGDANAPRLAVVKESGEMSVAAVETADEHYLSFRAGADTVYTFGFEYEGEPIYLYDQLTGEATLIQTGNTYTFEATNKTPLQRFLITKNPPRVPTDIESVGVEQEHRSPEKFIHEGQMFILHHGAVYDALGKRVIMRKEAEL